MVKKICAKCFIWIMLFMMYLPILVLCVYSFTDSKTLGSWNGFGFINDLCYFDVKFIPTYVSG